MIEFSEEHHSLDALLPWVTKYSGPQAVLAMVRAVSANVFFLLEEISSTEGRLGVLRNQFQKLSTSDGGGKDAATLDVAKSYLTVSLGDSLRPTRTGYLGSSLVHNYDALLGIAVCAYDLLISIPSVDEESLKETREYLFSVLAAIIRESDNDAPPPLAFRYYVECVRSKRDVILFQIVLSRGFSLDRMRHLMTCSRDYDTERLRSGENVLRAVAIAIARCTSVVDLPDFFGWRNAVREENVGAPEHVPLEDNVAE